MSKPRQFYKTLGGLNLRPLEWAFIAYYAEQYGIAERSEVVRSMINGYVNADKRFEPKQFLAYCQKTLAKEESDEVLAGEIVRQARQFVEEKT